jgi:hypothetical protein
LSSSRNALTAFRSVGAAGPSPSAISCARPSSKKVGPKRLVRRRRRGADSARDVAERPGARKLARSQGGAPRLEIGLAREVDVEQLELLRRLQQLRSANPEARGGRDPRAQQIDACALKLVNMPHFGGVQHRQCRVERTSLEACLCRRQRALGAPRWVCCQGNSALQKCGSGGDPAASLSPVSRQLELEGNLLVWAKRSMRAVPRTAIGINLRIRGACQRPMCVPTLVGGRGR